jgi:hypothetical protein
VQKYLNFAKTVIDPYNAACLSADWPYRNPIYRLCYLPAKAQDTRFWLMG